MLFRSGVAGESRTGRAAIFTTRYQLGYSYSLSEPLRFKVTYLRESAQVRNYKVKVEMYDSLTNPYTEPVNGKTPFQRNQELAYHGSTHEDFMQGIAFSLEYRL